MRGVACVFGARLRLAPLAAHPEAHHACSRAWHLYRCPSSGWQEATWHRCISTTSCARRQPRVAVCASSAHDEEAEQQLGMVAIGKVMAAQANFVRVKVDSVEGAPEGAAPPRARLLCVVRGLLKKIKQNVLVGDRVRVVGIDWTDGRGMVEDVLPRSSELSDPAVANVDHVVLVFAADLPPFQPAQVTRYLVSTESQGLPVTLLVNKADLVAPEAMQGIVEQVAGWGYKVLPVSVVSGDGLAELGEQLQGRVSVVAGPSGAGKSSIINALRLRAVGLEGSLAAMRAEPSGRLGSGSGSDGSDEEDLNGSSSAAAEAAPGDQERDNGSECSSSSSSSSGGVHDEAEPGQHRAGEEPGALAAGLQLVDALEDLELQAVGDVSERIGRGKHTTRNVTLLELGGGALLADTPGFNQPVLGMPASELGAAFPEVRERLREDRCAFSNCQHLAEPGCVVRGDWERYGYYCDLHAELAAQEEVERERAASKKRREGTVRFKSRAGGRQGAEARLETKTHRRVSRRSVKQGLSELAKKGLGDDDDE